MSEYKSPKATMKNPFTDKIFTAFFVGMIMTVLFGGRGMAVVARISGLGPGWAELFQGGFTFLFLILLAIRAFQLGKQRKALQQDTRRS